MKKLISQIHFHTWTWQVEVAILKHNTEITSPGETDLKWCLVTTYMMQDMMHKSALFSSTLRIMNTAPCDD